MGLRSHLLCAHRHARVDGSAPLSKIAGARSLAATATRTDFVADAVSNSKARTAAAAFAAAEGLLDLANGGSGFVDTLMYVQSE